MAESDYPKSIHEINTQGTVTQNNKDILKGFLSLLFVRTYDYRCILESVLRNGDRSYIGGVLFNEKITVETILSLPIEKATNILIGLSAGYIYKCLQRFNLSIIKSISEESWVTTDNPVLVKCKSNDQLNIDFMGIDTKVLCPLTPDYLAYLDHSDSGIDLYSDMGKLKNNKVNEITDNIFKKIIYDLTNRDRITKYLILPTMKNN